MFFKDLSQTASSQQVQDFTKTALLYLQCEKFYCIHYWRFPKKEEFVISRITASYLRIGCFLTYFHEQCFPTVFRRMTALHKIEKENAGDKDILGRMELLFHKQEQLSQLQTMMVSALEDILHMYKNKNRGRDPLGIYIKKLLYLIKGMLTKNSSYLKQETDNLFGQIEKSLHDKVIVNNKLISALLREKKEILKSPIASTNRNPLKNLMMMELASNTEQMHRKTITKKPNPKPKSESPEANPKIRNMSKKLINLSVDSNGTLSSSFNQEKISSATIDLNKAINTLSVENRTNHVNNKLALPLTSKAGKDTIEKPQSHNPFLSRGSKHEAPLVASGLVNSSSQKNLLIVDKRQEQNYNTLNDVVIINIHNAIMELERSRSVIDKHYEIKEKEERKKKDEFNQKEKEMIQKKINEEVLSEKQQAAQIIPVEKQGNSNQLGGDKGRFFSPPEKRAMKEYSDEKINTFNEGVLHKNAVNYGDDGASSLSVSLIPVKKKEPSFLYKFASNLLRRPHPKKEDDMKKSSSEIGLEMPSKSHKLSWLYKVKSYISGTSSTSVGSTSPTHESKAKKKMNIREIDLIRIDSNTKFKEDLRYVPCKENIVAVPRDFKFGGENLMATDIIII
jgi:hypothetical protein